MQDYEGQAAMELEALTGGRMLEVANGYTLGNDGALDFAPLLAALADLSDPAEGAALFHGTVAAGVAAWIAAAARRLGQRQIVLSGGCFHNRALTENLLQRLA
ncbi:carbamoyltransferase HypF, partial [Mycobacterium tuberculosis]|nr:carbamoyltransferase HypF [Mycobacterium tuberculosis]